MAPSKRICVLEDDPEISGFIQKTLEEKGFQVLAFNRCFQALESLDKVHSDNSLKPILFLVENLMPDQTGGEFCKRVRGITSYQHTPIILLSALANSDEEAKAKMGCNAFLSKPLDPEKLMKAVNDCFSNGSNKTKKDEVDEKNQPTSNFSTPTERAPLLRGTPPPSGDLKESVFDLPQILCHYYQEKATGKLDLHHSDVSKSIYFEKGVVVFASSDAEADRLKTILISRKFLSSDQLKDALVLSGNQEDRLQQVLMELNLLDPHKLFQIKEAQIKNIVHSIFIWDQGNYEFSKNETLPPDQLRLQLELPALLFEGISNAFEEERLVSRLGEGHWVLAPTGSFTDGLKRTKLGPMECKTAALADGKKDMAAILMESSLPEVETLHILYSLFCLGYLQAFIK